MAIEYVVPGVIVGVIVGLVETVKHLATKRRNGNGNRNTKFECPYTKAMDRNMDKFADSIEKLVLAADRLERRTRD